MMPGEVTGGVMSAWRTRPTTLVLVLLWVAMVTATGGDTHVAKGVLPLRARDTLDGERTSPGKGRLSQLGLHMAGVHIVWPYKPLNSTGQHEAF